MVSVAKVWLGLATVSFLSVVLVSAMMTDADNQFIRDTTNRFSKLSRADLLNAWHAENHQRCRHQLISTIDLACRFDPYRINTTRHRQQAVDKSMIKRDVSLNKTVDVQPLPNIPFTLSKTKATSFLNDEKYEESRRKIYLREECSWDEFRSGCRVLNRVTGKLLSAEEVLKMNSATPFQSDGRKKRSQESVSVKENCTGEDSSSDCKRDSNLTQEIPYALSKREANSFLKDEKRSRIQLRVYIQEGCSWDEFGKGCMVRSTLTEEAVKRFTWEDPFSYQPSKSSQQSSEVDSCSWEEYSESCKRHPSREDELAQFRSTKSAPSFIEDKPLRQGKKSRSIMEECCLRKGCFWEEYGEFCHEHPRHQTEQDSVCPKN